MSFIAGIDLGTTSVRVGLFDGDGARLVVTQSALPSLFPAPDRVEQDPDLLVSLPLDLLKRAIAEAGITVEDVAGIGLACQRGTFVGWDAATGEAVAPAIGWQDRRTQPGVDELRAAGIPVNTMASCTKMGWLLTQHDGARAALSQGSLRIGTIDTWITWVLTGGEAFVTDPSNAGATGLYDGLRREWSEPALDLFGIDGALLPEVVDSASIVGETRPELLGTAIPIASRVGDQQAACFAHRMSEGGAKLTLGTSAMLDVGVGANPAPPPAGAHVLPLWRIGSREPSCVEGSIAAAGGAIEWLVRVGLLGSVSELDDTAARGRDGITMVPALAGLGTPHDDSSTRATFAGIGLDTTPADLVLGVVDGIAMRCAELADALGVTAAIPVDGGMSRSRIVLQRIADATGRAILPAQDPETTLTGAAMMAASVVGGATTTGPVELGPAVEPETTEAERDDRRGRFAAMIETITS